MKAVFVLAVVALVLLLLNAWLRGLDDETDL